MRRAGKLELGRLLRVVALAAAACSPNHPWSVPPAAAAGPSITIASTTSLEQSGLFAYLLPIFTRETGITVTVSSFATSQALRMGQRGLADIVIGNDAEAVAAFVKAGDGLEAVEILYNDFVIAGPPDDPAAIRSQPNAAAALRSIAERRVQFVSRGDGSGTASTEHRLWDSAKVNPKARSGRWYHEVGLGMSDTLSAASRLSAYVLSDRATFRAHHNHLELEIHLEGDPALRNVYVAAIVSPTRSPKTDYEACRRFIDWVLSASARKAVSAFRAEGQQVFYPVGETPD